MLSEMPIAELGGLGNWKGAGRDEEYGSASGHPRLSATPTIHLGIHGRRISTSEIKPARSVTSNSLKTCPSMSRIPSSEIHLYLT